MSLKNLQNFYATERVPSGAARLLGLHIYRCNGFTEIEIGLWSFVIFVSLRDKATID
jgi:hypothetical protein